MKAHMLVIMLLLCVASTSALLVTDTTFQDGTFTNTTNSQGLRMITEGTIGYYEFNETAGATVYDFSHNMNNGTIVGATRIPGIGYSFDGKNDYIQLPNHIAYDTQQVAVLAWVSFNNLDYVGGSGVEHAIASKGAQDEDFAFTYNNLLNTNFLYSEIGINGGFIATNGVQTLSNDTTYLLALQHPANQRAQSFFENTLLAQSVFTGGRFYQPNVVRIGRYGTDYLNGTIARIIFLNQSVSTTRLAELDNNLTLPPTGTYTSQEYDLGSNPLVTVTWNAQTPAGTGITMEYAVSNSSGTGYSSWRTLTNNTQIEPWGRYFRYRAVLSTTDQQTSARITSITLSSTQQGPQIGFFSNTDLDEDQTNPYYLYFSINDTASTTQKKYRYRIGTGAWSSWANIVGSYPSYYTTITQAWSSYNMQTFYVQVNYTNSAGSNVTVDLSKQIQDVNHPPTFATIGNKNAQESFPLTFTISAFDQDGDTLSFTSDTFTISPISNGLADATWTPGPTDIGNVTAQFSVSDGTNIVLQTITILVQNVNDAPTITSAPDITGYKGVPMNFSFAADDIDGDPLTFSVTPAYFTITPQATGNSTAYTGYVYNYIPLLSHLNTERMTLTVNDGTETTSESIGFDINYCGDLVCQSAYEDKDNCIVDCDEFAFNKFSIVPPERSCFNTTINVTVYNATSRHNCDVPSIGKYGLALCNGLEDVELTFYLENEDGTLTEKGSGTTDEDGIVTFRVDDIGTYRIVGIKEGFSKQVFRLNTRECMTYNESSTQETRKNIVENKLVDKFKQSVDELLPINNSIEQPLEIVPNDPRANWVLMLIYFVIIPILLAGLMFVGNMYYEQNKNVSVPILKARIFVKEYKLMYLPQYLDIKRKVMPYYEMVAKPVRLYLGMAYELTKPVLKPVIDKVTELYDKTLKRR